MKKEWLLVIIVLVLAVFGFFAMSQPDVQYSSRDVGPDVVNDGGSGTKRVRVPGEPSCQFGSYGGTMGNPTYTCHCFCEAEVLVRGPRSYGFLNAVPIHCSAGTHELWGNPEPGSTEHHCSYAIESCSCGLNF